VSAIDLAHLLVILSGAIHAVVNSLIKSGANKFAGQSLMSYVSGAAMAPALLFVPLPHGAWGWLAAATLVHFLYFYALGRSYEAGDFSASYPIARGAAPLVTASFGLLLFAEPVTALELAGILSIAGGVMAMGLGRHIGGRGLAWSLATSLCIAGYTLIDAQGVRAAPTGPSFIVWLFVLLGVVNGTAFAAIVGRGYAAAVREGWKPAVVAGLLSIGTYGFALTAFRLGSSTAPLAALRETGIIVATIIAVLFLRETVDRRRLTAIAMIAAGAVLVLIG
jgi:drug/metabolite transporter (DMT)-like permease